LYKKLDKKFTTTMLDLTSQPSLSKLIYLKVELILFNVKNERVYEKMTRTKFVNEKFKTSELRHIKKTKYTKLIN